jgi:putative glycosyltransferase (TIGR04372 family)
MFHYVICFVSLPFCLVLNIRFLNVGTSRIGHLCVEPDCYIKEGILEQHPKYRTMVLAPKGNVANEHILSYWADYLKFIRSPLLCAVLKPLSNNRFTTYKVHKYAGPHDTVAAFPQIQKMYYEKKRRSLLSLTNSDFQRGWDFLQKIGMPRDAWFVCVHCREDGYLSGEGQTYRNANIANYLPALEAVIEKGGWVVRLGDPSMSEIPSNKYIIDYAHMDNTEDWMDVFFCAACKFFIGSASGLAAVSSCFGVPAAVANHAPVSVVLAYLPEDIGIPKLIYSLSEKRYLKFSEILGSPIGNFRFDSLYKEADISVVDNTGEDIKALAMEMLDKVHGKVIYTAEDNRLQDRFKSLMNTSHYSYGSAARIGRDFLRRYSFLLDH